MAAFRMYADATEVSPECSISSDSRMTFMLAVIEFSDVLLALCAAGIVALAYGLRSLHGRLRRIEWMLDVALRQMGIDWDELPCRELSRQVRAVADTGERQLAIELHQRESGLAFDDAQVAVEAYMRGELPDGALPLPVRRSA
jgi:hypothetical protein